MNYCQVRCSRREEETGEGIARRSSRAMCTVNFDKWHFMVASRDHVRRKPRTEQQQQSAWRYFVAFKSSDFEKINQRFYRTRLWAIDCTQLDYKRRLGPDNGARESEWLDKIANSLVIDCNWGDTSIYCFLQWQVECNTMVRHVGKRVATPRVVWKKSCWQTVFTTHTHSSPHSSNSPYSSHLPYSPQSPNS